MEWYKTVLAGVMLATAFTLAPIAVGASSTGTTPANQDEVAYRGGHGGGFAHGGGFYHGGGHGFYRGGGDGFYRNAYYAPYYDGGYYYNNNSYYPYGPYQYYGNPYYDDGGFVISVGI